MLGCKPGFLQIAGLLQRVNGDVCHATTPSLTKSAKRRVSVCRKCPCRGPRSPTKSNSSEVVIQIPPQIDDPWHLMGSADNSCTFVDTSRISLVQSPHGANRCSGRSAAGQAAREACLSLLYPRAGRQRCESDGSTASPSVFQRSTIPAIGPDLRAIAVELGGLRARRSSIHRLASQSGCRNIACRRLQHAKNASRRPAPPRHAIRHLPSQANKPTCSDWQQDVTPDRNALDQLYERCRRSSDAKRHPEHAVREPGLELGQIARNLGTEPPGFRAQIPDIQPERTDIRAPTIDI